MNITCPATFQTYISHALCRFLLRGWLDNGFVVFVWCYQQSVILYDLVHLLAVVPTGFICKCTINNDILRVIDAVNNHWFNSNLPCNAILFPRLQLNRCTHMPTFLFSEKFMVNEIWILDFRHEYQYSDWQARQLLLKKAQKTKNSYTTVKKLCKNVVEMSCIWQ